MSGTQTDNPADITLQLPLDFDQVLRSAEVVSRDAISARLTDEGYSPVRQTASYMQRIVQAEDAWETTLARARSELLKADAKQIY